MKLEGAETACVKIPNTLTATEAGKCGSLGGCMVERGSLLFCKMMNAYWEMLVLKHPVVGEEGGVENAEEGESAGKISTLEPKYG